MELRGDERARAIVPDLKVATDDDFAAEFLDLICAVGVVKTTIFRAAGEAVSMRLFITDFRHEENLNV